MCPLAGLYSLVVAAALTGEGWGGFANHVTSADLKVGLRYP